MKEYDSRYAMEADLMEALGGDSWDVPLRITLEGVRYSLHWFFYDEQDPEADPAEQSKFATLSIETGGKFFTAWEDLPEAVKEFFEPLRHFQGRFTAWSERPLTFCGFGVGLDRTEHQQLCELLGVDGHYGGTGTVFDLDTCDVHVPHAFFRDQGQPFFVVSKPARQGPKYRTRKGMEEYRTKLSRDSDRVDLLARTLGLE